jgi:hypothetical protein
MSKQQNPQNRQEPADSKQGQKPQQGQSSQASGSGGTQNQQNKQGTGNMQQAGNDHSKSDTSRPVNTKVAGNKPQETTNKSGDEPVEENSDF